MLSLDKIRGMLIGVILGDALGVPHEFRYQRNVPYTGKLEHKPYLIFRYQGTLNLAVGQYSDDGEMTLTLARSLAANKGYDVDNTLQRYIMWANSGTPLMGKNTRELLKGIKTLKGYQNRYTKKFLSTPQETWTISNGSLMRCSPLALIMDNYAVIQDCSLTNPHRVNQDTNQVYVSMVRMALHGYDPVTIISQLPSIIQTDEVRSVLSEVLSKTPRDLSNMKGWCLHGLYCAIWCLLYCSSYAEAINWVIGEHPGSDTDTNAAIVGGLMGALYGYNALMKEPQTGENITILRNMDTTTGDLPRPPEYTLHDFDELTQKLYDIFGK